MPPEPNTPDSTAPMTLADFTAPGLIVPSLRGKDAAAAIGELSESLAREKRVPDAGPLGRAALDRELMGGTEMQAGMAFPHARLAALKQLSFAFGRAEKPLAWGPNAVRSVRLVFLMAVPAQDPGQYLALVSGLARLAKDSRLAERLLTSPDARQLLEVFAEVELRIRRPARAVGGAAG